MSLDVSLFDMDSYDASLRNIPVRRDGRTVMLSRDEWDKENPGVEPATIEGPAPNEVYWGNITHNLGSMAAAAGIYKHLWRPEEIPITRAKELIEPLEAGLKLLKDEPNTFRKFNSPNGWGTYEGLVRFVEEYLAACKENPDARVSVSR